MESFAGVTIVKYVILKKEGAEYVNLLHTEEGKMTIKRKNRFNRKEHDRFFCVYDTIEKHDNIFILLVEMFFYSFMLTLVVPLALILVTSTALWIYFTKGERKFKRFIKTGDL